MTDVVAKQDTKHTNQSFSNPDDSNDQPPPSYHQTVGVNIALNSDFISKHPLSLTLKGEPFSRDFHVIDGQGSTVLRVDCAYFSAAHEMTLIQQSSGQSLFTIRKKQFSMSWRYSAELPGGNGQNLFETETMGGLFSGGETYMKFRNAMTGQMDQLQVDLHTYSGPSEVKYQGKKIADIDKRMSFSTSWALDIHEPGVDPLLIVVLALVIADRARTKRRRA